MASISVVIPTLDEALVLEGTLDAARAQLREGDEVWVVDAGSRDATREIAARRARLLASPGPRGRQLNEGAAHSRGEILLFLHADCRLPPGALDRVRAALADPGAAGGCFPVVFPPAEIARSPLLLWVQGGINLRTCLLRQGTGDQGIFTRRATFFEVGGFPAWPLMEDLDLCRRLKRAGRFRILDLPLQTSARRWLRDGVIRTQLKMWGFRAAFALGIPPHALARRYASIR
jgi:rSAM/selenodomain-associated transferase 2